MFKVTIDNTTYKVKFQHNFNSKHIIDSEGVHRKQVSPCRTTCIIVNEKTKKQVADGVSAPVKELAVLVKDAKAALQKYRRRLKKVYPLDVTDEKGNPCYVAIIKGDHFKYSEGRRRALEKALDVFSKEDRVIFWHALLTMENPPVKVKEDEQAQEQKQVGA